MMEATLNLVSREALELHYQGVTYGPIAHTQALGVLLFALQPASVRCATQPGAFEAAMQQVLAAARKTTDLLTTWAEEASPAERSGDPRLEHLQRWLDAGCRTAPRPHCEAALRATLRERLGKDGGPVLH